MKKPVHEILGQINEVSRLLTCFKGLDADFPAILAVATKAVAMRSALIIESSGGSAKATIWCSPDAPAEAIATAKAHAQAAYAHLTRLGPDEARLLRAGQTLKESPVAAQGLTPDLGGFAKHWLVLPLVVDQHPIFGVLQVECTSAPDEAALAFVNALANQLSVALDRSSLQRRERELARREQAAEAASLAKSRFLANMSHEIRTPLGAILGFTELLLNPETEAKKRDLYAATIRRNGGVLARLIDDILDLSKVEAGKLDIESVPVSLPGLLAEVATLLSPRAREKGIAFELVDNGPLPDVVSTDPTRLKQILFNIVGNAIKFTERGVVRVKSEVVATEPALPGQRTIAFIVSDTGRGITPEAVQRLFQPFEQADNTTTRKFGGTGLGLVLSRRLARAMGGDVVLDNSVPGGGSTFRVTVRCGIETSSLLHWQELPRDPVPVAPPAASRPRILSGKRILLIEDTSDNQVLFNSILKASGASVDTVSDGIDGVAQAFKCDYDVVLMDLQMPRCDGFKATAELRRLGYRKPIIALSAYAMKEDRERALEAGCDDHLSKPVNTQTLVSTVADFAQGLLH